MAKSRTPTPGAMKEDGLLAALRELALAPRPGARRLAVLHGILPKVGFAGSAENVLIDAGGHVVSSGRVYKLGGDVVIELRPKGDYARLAPLTEGASVVSGAEDLLANLAVCQAEDGQFPPPKWFVDLLLRSEPLLANLPAVRTYARRPVFDDQLVLRGPGWHPEVGVLVHGPAVDPVKWVMAPETASAQDRLPPRLRSLLGGFCFRSDADVSNAVGVLLTTLLVGRYVAAGKPVVLLDGNQPGLGKSLLARVAGLIADGSEPALMRYTADDEELQKRIGAQLRGGCGSVMIVDNAKTVGGAAISSPTLESLTAAPEVSLRLLGQSALIRRPNDLVWMLTMNDTRVSADMLSRGVPVRLYHEGDPAERTFDVDVVAFATKYRVEILGELAGMVDHWTATGRNPGTARHRFKEWAAEVGGILAACGFTEFLANVAEAAGEFAAEGDELTALAEYVADRREKIKPLTAGGWVSIFQELGLLEDALSGGKSDRSKRAKVGQFLGRLANRCVDVETKKWSGTATLKAGAGRSREKTYFFELVGSETVEADKTTNAAKATSRKPAADPAEVASVEESPPVPVIAEPVNSVSGTGNTESW